MEIKIACQRCRKFVHAYNKLRQFKFDFPHIKLAFGLIQFNSFHVFSVSYADGVQSIIVKEGSEIKSVEDLLMELRKRYDKF